ncbi:MAG TPA: 30S ribosomal protein S16 [Anaerolineae bacterium]|nr:30S ribosomal protein S16 [Anaerolineae bacterium]
MLRIRLRRVGLKKQPAYRMVVAENEWPRDGRFLEIVGRYNPRTNPETVEVNEERMYHWLKNGALPTESVAKILTKQGTMGRFERVQKGEDLQAVLAEAQTAAETARTNTPRRTNPETVAAKSKKNLKTGQKKK